MNRWVVYLMLLAAGGAFYLQSRRQRRERVDLEARIARLTRALAESDARRRSAQILQLFQQAPAAPEATAAPQRPPPPPAPTMEELAERIERSFGREVGDRAWASAARQSVVLGLGSILPDDSALRALECRSSMCRMELVHGSAAVYQAFQERAFRGTSDLWRGGVMTTSEDLGDGKVASVAYLLRDGVDLPVDE